MLTGEKGSGALDYKGEGEREKKDVHVAKMNVKSNCFI